jgi:hypothetical protein
LKEGSKERDYSKELGVVGRIILNWILGKLFRVLDCIDLSQDRYWWQALVSTVMNRVLKRERGVS